jgi:hypothetical protein
MKRRVRALAVVAALLAVILAPHAVLVFTFVLAVAAAGTLAVLIGRRVLTDLVLLEVVPCSF